MSKDRFIAITGLVTFASVVTMPALTLIWFALAIVAMVLIEWVAG